eukprot:1002935-Heterocapsa_arctica.AAC.1
MVELWLIDTGCAHDLASIAHIARSGDKLCSLTDHVNFQTANGGTVSNHTAPVQISGISERIN